LRAEDNRVSRILTRGGSLADVAARNWWRWHDPADVEDRWRAFRSRSDARAKAWQEKHQRARERADASKPGLSLLARGSRPVEVHDEFCKGVPAGTDPGLPHGVQMSPDAVNNRFDKVLGKGIMLHYTVPLN
jgi:hypothetical protein